MRRFILRLTLPALIAVSVTGLAFFVTDHAARPLYIDAQ